MHRPGDVLDLLITQIVERNIHLAIGVTAHPRRDANSTRLRQSFKACSEVDAIAENVPILHDDIALMNADAKLYAPFGRHVGISYRHRTLHLSRAGHCLHNAWELDQHAVAGRLDDAAFVFSDVRIDQLTAMRLEP